MRTVVLLCALAAAPVSAQSPIDSLFRSFDGRDNNLRNPNWGRAGIVLRRVVWSDYADNHSEPAGADRPSAREVSNVLSEQLTSALCVKPVTDFVWQWGQFIDHDIDLTGGGTGEAFPISVPAGDPWFDPGGTGTQIIPLERSIYLMRRSRRQQINEITAYLDASNVYGSDPQRAAELRAEGGLLKTSAGDLLPFNVNGFANAPTGDDPSLFLAGDVRANEQVALTAMHILFVREHNRLARILGRVGLSDELIYQFARMIVAAEIQAITYREFLPALLGEGAIRPYRGYRPRVNAGIANSFSTGTYRFGHSMLSPVLQRIEADGSVSVAGHLPLRDAFFVPQEIIDNGIESVLRGLASQRPQEVDCLIIDEVRNFLFGPPGSGGFDLAALNIQRGRDHGLPSYNRMRRGLDLPRARSFADISSNIDLQEALASVYDTVDQVDLWIGALAEDHHRQAMVGELLFHSFKDQFERLRDGDRFYYRRIQSQYLVNYIEYRTLSRIIRDNTDIDEELQANVFLLK